MRIRRERFVALGGLYIIFWGLILIGAWYGDAQKDIPWIGFSIGFLFPIVIHLGVIAANKSHRLHLESLSNGEMGRRTTCALGETTLVIDVCGIDEFTFRRFVTGLFFMNKRGEYFSSLRPHSILFAIAFLLFLMWFMGVIALNALAEGTWGLGLFGLFIIIGLLGNVGILQEGIEMIFWPRLRVLKNIISIPNDERINKGSVEKIEELNLFVFEAENSTTFFCLPKAEVISAVEGNLNRDVLTPLDQMLQGTKALAIFGILVILLFGLAILVFLGIGALALTFAKFVNTILLVWIVVYLHQLRKK